MKIAGAPAEGYKVVGDIVATHTLQYLSQTDVETIVLDLLTYHTPVAPIVDIEGHLEGFIGELEILDALEAGKDLTQLKAEDLMIKDDSFLVTETTPFSEAVNLLKNGPLPIVPVLRENRIIKSLTRHDLIRAMTGAGLGVEME